LPTVPEHRSHHRERLHDALRDEISTILEGELGDPRIGLVTLHDLQMAAGGKSVHVFINTDEPEEADADLIAGLNSAKGYIRRALIERLRLRQAPDLIFHVDRSAKNAERIESLLGRLKKRK
jgi:ribosome-binding factor A